MTVERSRPLETPSQTDFTVDLRPLVEGRRVLVFGFGVLGGGLATTEWLLNNGAHVTITDMKTADQLGATLDSVRTRATLHLGGHREDDVRESDIVVFNPGIGPRNPYVALARELGKRVENEATLFYRSYSGPLIAVTGTRGKTTVVNWTAYLLRSHFTPIIAGNSIDSPLLQVLGQLPGIQKLSSSQPLVVVNELPSAHLEFMYDGLRAPDLAIITNLYRDHLDRYGSSMEEYARTKARIFREQNLSQHLVLNWDNPWTTFFLRLQPASNIWFISRTGLPADRNGLVLRDETIFIQRDGEVTPFLSVNQFAGIFGGHGVENLLSAVMAAVASGISKDAIEKSICSLPTVPLRQQVVFCSPEITIVNDSAATSPEASIAALKRFASGNMILIAGGTDRELDYEDWADVVKSTLSPNSLILLNGSATKQMLHSLDPFPGVETYNDLRDCLLAAVSKAKTSGPTTIVFSPGAKSFEKFKNEYDRGTIFNLLVEETVR
jgi:UDP-N-acetylmuramoylalanine--D-glutamate ligase